MQPKRAFGNRSSLVDLKLVLHTSTGDIITTQKVEQTMFGARAYNGHRGELHQVSTSIDLSHSGRRLTDGASQILWNHAISLGVDIRCSSNVTSFWETEASCGVICNGERLEADVVVGADGVRSKARELVLVSFYQRAICHAYLSRRNNKGYEDKPISSGYAIYRAWFDAKESGVADDPLTSFLVEGGQDHFHGWLGTDHTSAQSRMCVDDLQDLC